jgi:hypothetical protein
MHANGSTRSNEAENSRSSAGTPPGRVATPLPALLALQGSVGNSAVVQMLRRARHPWAQDRHQHGADCGHQQAEQPVQRSTVHDVLRSPGQPMDDATRTDMEARLGADFSDVRIHNDTVAKASAAEVGARAYTSGKHVVLGEGGGDRHTLAHELTHVIQQSQGPVAGTDDGSGLKVSGPSDRFEREAEANAARVLSTWSPADVSAATVTTTEPHVSSAVGQPLVQRAKDEKITYKATNSAMNSAGGGMTSTNSFTGAWGPNVMQSGSRVMKPDERALRHIARQFYSAATKVLENKEQETQVLYVDGGIIVACNQDATINSLYDYLTSKTLYEVMTELYANDKRAQRSSQYMGGIAEGERLDGEVNNIMAHAMAVVGGDVVEKRDMSGAVGLVSGGGMDGKIILLESGTGDIHAEQKLVLALIKANWSGKAEIVGKKRPCATCFVTLSLARDKKLKELAFQDHSGGYWKSANRGLTLVANALGIKKDELEEYTKKMFPRTQYKTEGNQAHGSDSELSDMSLSQ